MSARQGAGARHGAWHEPAGPVPGDDRPCALLLPFAGGQAHSMREWARELGPGWRILVAEYPGRGRRAQDPPPATLGELAADLVDDYLALAPRTPPLLLGHSFGALVAHAAAARLESRGTTPGLLVLAAQAAPHTGTAEAAAAALLRLDDQELIRALGLADTLPADLLTPQLAALFLPPIRADLALARAHARTRPHPRVDCPVLAVGGRQDPLVPPDLVAAWSALAAGDFELRQVEGGHFFQRGGALGLDDVLTRALRHSAAPLRPTVESP